MIHLTKLRLSLRNIYQARFIHEPKPNFSENSRQLSIFQQKFVFLQTSQTYNFENESILRFDETFLFSRNDKDEKSSSEEKEKQQQSLKKKEDDKEKEEKKKDDKEEEDDDDSDSDDDSSKGSILMRLIKVVRA